MSQELINMDMIKMTREKEIEELQGEQIGFLIFLLEKLFNKIKFDRHYRCPLNTCGKAYGSEGSLS